jgi:hypothetical protein
MSRSFHKHVEVSKNRTYKFLENVFEKNTRHFTQKFMSLTKEEKKMLRKSGQHSITMPYFTSWERKQMRKATRRINKMVDDNFQFCKAMR